MALPLKPVSLQGTTPMIFTREQSLSDTFMCDPKIYKIMNPLADVMKQPYARIATALSLIWGPKVDDWVDEQLKDLELKVCTTPQSDETLWTKFEAAFTSAFTDTARKEDAYQKLKHLKMKDELVDDYIMAFNSLAAKAGWELNNTRTIDTFHSGLRPGTLNAIMNWDAWPDTMAQWQQAAQDELRKYLVKKAILSFCLSMGNQGNLGTRNQWQRRFGQCRQGGSSSSRDPNVMDVNAISTRNPLSEEEKWQLMAEGRCFFCKQQGHMSRNCPKKPNCPNATPTSPQPSHNTPPPPRVQTTHADNEETVVAAPEPKEGVDDVVNSIGHLNEGEKQELIDKLFAGGKDFWKAYPIQPGYKPLATTCI
jgi:Retrotransposon gag protein/Zinc knuckle